MDFEDFVLTFIAIWLLLVTLGVIIYVWIYLAWWIAAFATVGLVAVWVGAGASIGREE